MKTRHLVLVLLFLTALFCFELSYSQTCSYTPPASSSCTGTLLTSGANVNTGQTYYYSGSGSVNNVNLSGGTIKVCGTLNLTVNSNNGGSIIVEPGGSLTYSCTNAMQNSFINYGSLTITGSQTIQNNPVIYNASTATINFTGTGTIQLNSGNFYNNGIVTVSGTFNPQGMVICLGDQAILNTNSLNLGANNSFNFSGSATYGCVGVTGSANIVNNSLTTSNRINVCLAAGEITSGSSSHWGSALVSTNCTGCNIILPINSIQLSGSFQNNAVNLSWSQNGGVSSDDIFNAEESDNGTDFHSIVSIAANMNKSVYAFSDYNISADVQYYRIKQTDGYGAVYYSNIVAVKTGSIPSINVYPNPAVNVVNVLIQSSVQETISIQLADISGKMFSSKQVSLSPGKNIFSWGTGNLAVGTYMLKMQSPSQGNIIRLISVLRQ